MRLNKLIKFPYHLLAAIIILSFAIRIYNLNFNSVFLDEAFYIVIGQKILEGRIVEAFGDISWVGAFPLFYPLLSAISYEVGGILGTRFFTVILGTASIFLAYSFTKSLEFFEKKRDNEIASLIAASFMATSTIPIASSRLAIYDGLSFTLFLVGLNLYAVAIKRRRSAAYLISGIVFFLSFLAKYITIIFFPLLLLFTLFLKIKNIKKALGFFWLPLIALTTFYIGINFDNLAGYISGQVENRNTTYLDVLNTFWQYSNTLYLLAIGGLIIVSVKKKPIAISLFIISLVPISLHVVTRNNDSAHQHVFFSIIFILPLIGMFFAKTIRSYGKIAIAGMAFILLLNALSSIPQVRDLESFWPNSTNATTYLRERVKREDVLLIEGGDAIMLGLDKKIPQQQIVGPFVFDYKGLENEQAYVKALQDGYFRFVEIENVYFSTDSIALIEKILPLRYRKVFDDGRIKIYERKE